MQDQNEEVRKLLTALGKRPLYRSWAKIEILLGLLAAGGGLLLGDWAVARMDDPCWLAAGAGLALFVLGGYLAMAGHRSHLYQSSNELTAWLAQEIRSLREAVH